MIGDIQSSYDSGVSQGRIGMYVFIGIVALILIGGWISSRAVARDRKKSTHERNHP